MNSALMQGLVRKDIESHFHEFIDDVFGEQKLSPEFTRWASIIFEAGYLANPGTLRPKHLRFIVPAENLDRRMNFPIIENPETIQ